ncbi:MAG: sensor histidine kinase, partial [Actinomycetota bacterium]|nr:sensor histidine kinase [Actinomycetota bacterium]
AWTSHHRSDSREEAGLAPGRALLPLRLTGSWRLWWSAVWLVFLGYPIGDIVSRHHPAIWVISAWTALLVFVGLYLRTMWVAFSANPTDDEPTPAGWLAALICFTLGMVVLFGVAWGGVIIYLGVATGSTLRHRAVLVTLAALDAFTAVLGVAAGAGVSNVAFDCFLTTALGFTMLAFRRLVRLVIELEQARDEVARLTAAEERLRFSRDLHDVLGHSLSVVALKAQVARRTMASDPEAAWAALTDVETVARQSLSDVRQLVSGYRQQSLAEELAGAEELLEAAGITPRIARPPELPVGEINHLLAWAVREGTTNVIRHSRASHCDITVAGDESSAWLEIVDDGTRRPDSPQAGSGLRGLRERMERAGGCLEAGCRNTNGFRLAVRLPLAGSALPPA